jgi:xanthine dehydrogenase molybdopterin-binding subunit B
MNPEIDIGQVEGAFVMGLGYWLMEETKYDPTSGDNVTSSTWVSESSMTRPAATTLPAAHG